MGGARAPVAGSAPWPAWRLRVSKRGWASSSVMYYTHIPTRSYNRQLRQGLLQQGRFSFSAYNINSLRAKVESSDLFSTSSNALPRQQSDDRLPPEVCEPEDEDSDADEHQHEEADVEQFEQFDRQQRDQQEDYSVEASEEFGVGHVGVLE